MNRSTREIERDVERTRSDIEDTVEALRDKMSLGQIVDEAAHYWRGHGGDEVVSNLAAQARANPLPLALVGIGLAWLMSGRGQPAMNYWSSSSHGERAGSYGTGSSYRSGSTYAGSGAYQGGSSSSSGIGSRVGEAASSAKGAISDTGRKAGEAVSSGMHKVGDTASQAYDRVSDTASQTYGRVSDTASQTYERMADRAGRVQRNMSDLIESEPLILAGLGLAVGAAIGAMMPATRAENRLMGDKLEEWKHDASEMAREEWEKTKSVAKDAVSAAKTEIEKGGPLGETADRAAKSAASTAERSASDKGLGSSTSKS